MIFNSKSDLEIATLLVLNIIPQRECSCITNWYILKLVSPPKVRKPDYMYQFYKIALTYDHKARSYIYLSIDQYQFHHMN